jgi:hypothetical protein
MDAGLGDALFYLSIAAGFAIAYPFAFLANRYLIARGKGTPASTSTITERQTKPERRCATRRGR